MRHSLKILSKVAFRVTAIVVRAGEVVVHDFFVGLAGIGCVVLHCCVDNIVAVGVRSFDSDFWRRWIYFILVFNILVCLYFVVTHFFLLEVNLFRWLVVIVVSFIFILSKFVWIFYGLLTVVPYQGLIAEGLPLVHFLDLGLRPKSGWRVGRCLK